MGFVVDGVFDDVHVEDGVRVGAYFAKLGEHVLADGVLDEAPDGQICPTALSKHATEVEGCARDVHGIVVLNQRYEFDVAKLLS